MNEPSLASELPVLKYLDRASPWAVAAQMIYMQGNSVVPSLLSSLLSSTDEFAEVQHSLMFEACTSTAFDVAVSSLLRNLQIVVWPFYEHAERRAKEKASVQGVMHKSGILLLEAYGKDFRDVFGPSATPDGQRISTKTQLLNSKSVMKHPTGTRLAGVPCRQTILLIGTA